MLITQKKQTFILKFCKTNTNAASVEDSYDKFQQSSRGLFKLENLGVCDMNNCLYN